MRTILTALLMVVVLPLAAQNHIPASENYHRYTDSAGKLYDSKAYKAAALLYDKAFEENGSRAVIYDRYNAVCCWALAGDPDKAFEHLQKLANDKWPYLTHLQEDSDLVSLHSDPRWVSIIAKVQKNRDEAMAKLDQPLIAQLDTIFQEDQVLRLQIDSISKQHGRESREMKALLTSMFSQDSINLQKVKRIIDTRGWLGADVVGERGNTTMFLVIQHADSATQEHYLPLMRQAVKEGKAQPSQLALLEDRTRMRRGEKQVYGSQVITDPATGNWMLYTIEDEPNVNKRRAAVGLEPLEVYARQFGIVYKLPEKKN